MGAAKPFQHQPHLAVDGLALVRGQRTLVRELSFAAGPGDFLAIRGANGAGKTSLLRALAGFLRPAQGRIRFDGIEEPELALHFLGHLDALKTALDARAHVRFWAGLLGEGDAVRADAALQQTGLAAIADLPARALSQGQRRRLSLARLIAAPRPIWLLDEPAAGLDQNGRALLDALIAEHRAAGGLVLAALHEPLGAAPFATIELGQA